MGAHNNYGRGAPPQGGSAGADRYNTDGMQVTHARGIKKHPEQAFSAHKKWLDACKPDENTKVKRRKSIPPPPPLAIRSQPGTGKSTAAAELMAEAQIPVLYTGDRVDAIESIHTLIIKKGGSAREHQPRKSASPDPDIPIPSSVCWQMPGVQLTGELRHLIASTLCKHCPHGCRTEYIAADTIEKRAEIADRYDNQRANHPDMPELIGKDVKACGYTAETKKDRDAKILLATLKAVSPGMMDWVKHSGRERETQARLLVIDELPLAELYSTVTVKKSTVSSWITKAQEAKERERDYLEYNQKIVAEIAPHEGGYRQTVRRSGDTPAVLVAAEHLEQLERARRHINLEEMLSGAVAGFQGALDIWDDADITEFFNLIQGMALRCKPFLNVHAAAPWETFSVEWVQRMAQVTAPLRALVDMAEAIKYDAVRTIISHNEEKAELLAITYDVPSPIARQLLDKKHSFVLLDATPSRSVQAIVQMRGGKIIDADDERVAVHVNTEKRYYQGRNKPKQQWNMEARGLLAKKRIMKRPDHPLALFAYKRHVDALLSADSSLEGEAGYWGAGQCGERHHNNWAGWDGIIAGEPAPPPTEVEMSYKAERMLVLLAKEQFSDQITSQQKVELERNWPKWDGERENKPRDDGRTHYANEVINDWYEDMIAREIAQAIGRFRALLYPDVQITLLGRPTRALKAYGIDMIEDTVQYDQFLKDGGKALKHTSQLEHKLTIINAMRKQGKAITREEVRQFLHRPENGGGLGNDMWSEVLQITAGDFSRTNLENCIKRLRGVAHEYEAQLGVTAKVSQVAVAGTRARRTIVHLAPTPGWNGTTLNRAIYDKWLASNEVSWLEQFLGHSMPPARAP
jgi:hypothetical protein